MLFSCLLNDYYMKDILSVAGNAKTNKTASCLPPGGIMKIGHSVFLLASHLTRERETVTHLLSVTVRQQDL